MQDDVADEMPDLIPLATRFDDRAALAGHVASLSNLTPPPEPSPIIGGRAAAVSPCGDQSSAIFRHATILTALLPGCPPISGMGC